MLQYGNVCDGGILLNYLHKVIDELKNKFPQYEERNEQRQMWETVYKSMKEGKKVAVHAPTGTGKSLGYVIPFIAVKLEDPDFTITISTFTLNLQDQFVKDLELGIDLFKRIDEREGKGRTVPRYTVLKGVNNFFCAKRFGENEPLFKESKRKAVEKRLEGNREWTRQGLGVPFSASEWELAKVEGCTKRECPFHRACSYFSSYNGLHDKDVVILNHSLFLRRFYFVDPWSKQNYFVFDEAHKLEGVLMSTYTFELATGKIKDWLEHGASLSKKYGSEETLIDKWKTYFLEDDRFLLFARLEEALHERMRDKTALLKDLRIPLHEAEDILKGLMSWHSHMIRTYLNTVETDEQKNNDAYKEERKGWYSKLMDLKEFIALTHQANPKGVLWAERRGESVFLKVSPSSLSSIPTPFTKGCLLTSGTLAEEGTIDAYASRLRVSLDDEVVLPSPFPLKSQTMVHLAEDVDPKRSDYEQKLESYILEILGAGELKSFVLFTNESLMKRMQGLLSDRIRRLPNAKDKDVEIWIQQKTNHRDVMRSFEDPGVRSVLFGTLGYFEGIDLKGESLSQVILTRLPFSVPTHPIQQLLNKEHPYSSWEALVRYEQAFGRLIRTSRDYGTFHILDNRVRYMTSFLNVFLENGIKITSDMDDIKGFYEDQREQR
ncbi:ATP-dependent DNA helicase (plasmid) [Pontibacillus sp. ALD_SL1]|uniref:ATP-dependent DNA helicase n=1 Tax=Pontibacillus sp. ALD_SL1 TaxID=2777185 RepID=UPI001A96C2BA|nr:ATP-dependent DNA helicase [Pontibacillus sp. ALD_SL1]QST02806.1 ATP-dependent DNA helicase [Pontibacillus sp. ALD_SL1]